MQNIGLLIADEIQLVGGEVGPTYEVVISRTRYVSDQTENKTRIVACGVSLANARDFGEWMGARSHNIFNFSPRSVAVILSLLSGVHQIFHLQRTAIGHGHPPPELYYPSLPFPYDCYVETGLPRYRRIFSNQTCYYLRPFPSPMPPDCRRSSHTLCCWWQQWSFPEHRGSRFTASFGSHHGSQSRWNSQAWYRLLPRGAW